MAQARIYNLSNLTLDEVWVIENALMDAMNGVNQRLLKEEPKAKALYEAWEVIPFDLSNLEPKAAAGGLCSAYLRSHPDVRKIDKEVQPIRKMIETELFRNCRKVTEAGNLRGKKG